MSFSGSEYLYAIGGSSDGTAANGLSSIEYATVNSTTGNVGSFTTNGNNLTTALTDPAVVSFVPAVDSGTGADGTLDLSLADATGGCVGDGLSWDTNTSTCTIATHDRFVSGPSPGQEITYGAHSFEIPSGPQAGKMLTITGKDTYVFDPTSNTFLNGPSFGDTTSYGSHSFLIPSGPQAGKVLTVTSGGSTSRIYDPTTDTFGAGPTLSGSSSSGGGHSFPILSGPNAGKVLTVAGGGSSLTNIYDPATNTYSAGPNLGAAALYGSHSFLIPSGPHSGKYLTVIGNWQINKTRLYDPATNSYSAGPDIGATPNGTGGGHIPSQLHQELKRARY